VDDAFFIDLGPAFDSLNFRVIPGPGSTGIPAVLSQAQDGSSANFVPDDVSGYNVNCIAVQAPIALLHARGRRPGADDPLRQVGLWGTTSRAEVTLRASDREDRSRGKAVQVQRLANPLVNELLIGTDRKNDWSRAEPRDDKQFQAMLLDPLIVRIGQAAFAALGVSVAIPAPPRLDLAPLVFYSSGPKGPLADLLRLDLSSAPTPAAERNRLGGCGGDPGGFPNGRRLGDDVLDCFLRVGFGLLTGADVPRLGDGVNSNDRPIRETFPFIAPAQDGRGSRHVDPGEPGCGLGGGSTCPN
jgi:hypothetical protein